MLEFFYNTFLNYFFYLVGIWFIFLVIDKFTTKKHSKKFLLIVLGSGGHTGEMIRLLDNFDCDNYRKICFIRSNNDKGSEIKMCKNLGNLGS